MAAYNAAEAAIRLIKPGKTNWEVSEAIQKISDEYACNPVEGKVKKY
jgi:methionine aminopeptidase